MVGVPVECPGFRWTVDYERNNIRVAISRSCIGKPEWVRGLVGFTRRYNVVRDGWLEWREATNAALGRPHTFDLRYGPRVYRG